MLLSCIRGLLDVLVLSSPRPWVLDYAHALADDIALRLKHLVRGSSGGSILDAVVVRGIRDSELLLVRCCRAGRLFAADGACSSRESVRLW